MLVQALAHGLVRELVISLAHGLVRELVIWKAPASALLKVAA